MRFMKLTCFDIYYDIVEKAFVLPTVSRFVKHEDSTYSLSPLPLCLSLFSGDFWVYNLCGTSCSGQRRWRLGRWCV